ncbi:MAG: hypothetical protein AAGB46_18830 [Verrucomicrobiota bacterium]
MEPPIVGAAISGQFIGFSEIDSEAKSRFGNYLHLASSFLANSDNDWMSGEAELFQGDSWQFFCPDPTKALPAAIAIRGFLRNRSKLDCKVSLGFGSVDHLDVAKVSLSHGKAFSLSRLGMKDLVRKRTFSIRMSEKTSVAQSNADAVAYLLDVLMTLWTPTQAYSVALMMTGASRTELASQLNPPISKQAFGKRLFGARWKEVDLAIKSFSSTLPTLYV